MKKFFQILLTVLILVATHDLTAQVSSVSLEAPTAQTDVSITLNATITTSASTDVNYSFDYGTTSGIYGFSAAGSESGLDGSISIGEDLVGLTSGEQYFYKFTASSAAPLSSESTVESSFWTLATEPDANPTGLTYESKSDGSITISLTEEPTADGYLILYRTGTNGPNKNGVTDGVKHTDAGDFDQATGFYYSDGGDNTVIEIPDLIAETVYSFNVISYAYAKDGLGNEVTTTYNYVTTDNKINEISTTSVIPSTEVTNFIKTSSTSTGMTFSYDEYTGFADNGGTVVYFETGNSVDLSKLENGFQPLDQPTIGTDYGIQNVDAATSITVLDGKLLAGTKYSFRIVPFNFNGSDNATIGYYTANAPTITHYTLSAPADGGADIDPLSFELTNVTNADLDVNWATVTNAAGYLVLYTKSSATLDDSFLENGVNPANQPYPTGTGAVNHIDVVGGGATSVNVAGLDADTDYAFKVIPYTFVNDGGAVEETYNYNNDNPPLESAKTLCEDPTEQVTALQASNINASQMDISWTDGSGLSVLAVARLSSVAQAPPVDGTDYTANNDFSAANQIGATDNFVVYEGTGTNFTLTGLEDFQEYSIDLYVFNDNGFCYENTGVTITETTLCDPATTTVSSTSTSGISFDEITLNWTIEGAGNNVLIIARESATAAEIPASNIDYTENSEFALGDELGTGNFAVYDGSGSTVTVTGLNELTDYSFDIYEYNPTRGGFCYNTTAVTLSGTTDCQPPSSTASFNAPANITAGSVDLSWGTVTGADAYLIVAKQGPIVDLPVNSGDDFTALANSNFVDAGDGDGSSGNKIVHAASGTSVSITGLTSSTQYTFAIYAYVNGTFCYSFGPDTETITTSAPSTTSTLTLKAEASTISSVDNDASGTYITVMDFDIEDLGDDGIPIRISEISFNPAIDNDFVDWTQIIADAKVVNTTNANEISATISASELQISVSSPANNGSGDFGYVDDGSIKNYQLQIRLLESISIEGIDGENFTFELDPNTIVTTGNSSGFDTSMGTEIFTDATANEVAVIATAYDFSVSPPATVNAGENIAQQAIVKATDENGNVDLDYNSALFSISNADNIPMQNLPSPFSSGELTFPTTFNYQGSGDGTLTITDTNDGFSNSSSAVTVNPTAQLAQLTVGVNTGVLQSGTTDNAVLGFAVDALGSTQMQAIEFSAGMDLSNIVANLRLVSSINATYEGVATDAVIASSPTIDNGNNTITFSGLTESFSTESKNYFLIVDVDESVNEFDTPDLSFALDIADISFNNNTNKVVSNFSRIYGFEDITNPLVDQLVASPTIISDNNTGTDAIQISITFNEEMDPLTIPTISFPVEDPTASLSGPTASSTWSAGNTVYTLYYDLSDQNELVENVDVKVVGAVDKSGNNLLDYTESNVFTIDTENPTANPIVLNKSLITRSDNTLEVEITYNKEMNPAEFPTLTVQNSTDLAQDGNGTWSSGNTVYTVDFIHGLTEEEITSESIEISGGEDILGNLAVTNSTANFTIDTERPRIIEILPGSSDGLYGPGDIINLKVVFSEDVGISGAPEISLNSGGTAVFQSVTNGNEVNFSYTVGAANSGENASDLDVTLIDMNGGSITDIAGNDANPIMPISPNRLQDNADIQVDTNPAIISNVSSTTADGFYGENEVIEITIEFNEFAFVSGSPQLELNTGDLAVYQSGSGSALLTFSYTVQASDGGSLVDVSDLNYTTTNSLSLNGGSIVDQAGIDADLALPGTGTGSSLGGNKNITIDTDVPELVANPFNPATGELNVSQQMNFSIELDEPVLGAGSNNIRIVEKSSGDVLETLDGATAFTSSATSTLSFSSLENILNDSTEYYFEIDAGAITDRAGNAYAGFSADHIWSFTTFGPARIDDFSKGACVGETFTIQGEFFTGVSRIRTNIDGGAPFTISSFTVIDDENIEFIVPAGTEPGTITLDKQNGQAGNTDDASTTSENNIKVGPSSAQLVLVNPGSDVVCDDPGDDNDSPIETSLRVDIVGGSGTYTLEYSNGVETIEVTGYTSGQVLNVNPPQGGVNTYEIVSLTDEDEDLNTCSAPDLGSTLDIEEYTRSTVEAGGIYDSEFQGGLIEICLATTNQIDFSDAGLVGLLPSITGNVSTGTWSIDQGPSQNSGGFSPDGTVKTTTNLQPIYYPSLADAAEGEIVLRLISDDPAAPNPCVPDEDVVKIRFVSTISVRIGDNLSVCKQPIDNTTEIAIAQLNAALGGGADGIEWTRVDQFGEAADHDGSWGFADSESDNTFTLTSSNPQAIYKASPLEVNNGSAVIEAIPTATAGACGGTPDPRQLEITINDLPTPSKSSSSSIVCSGEEGVRFSMTPSSSESTFAWTLSSNGQDTEGLNDKNEIDGLKTGNIVRVNFREVSEETQDTLVVQEISTLTSCVSLADTFFITVKPAPIANILYDRTTTLSNEAPLILLEGEGGLKDFEEPGGEFFGPGVIKNSSGDYFLDTSQLGVTDIIDDNDVHEVFFRYTDEFGCSTISSKTFNIFDAETIFPKLQVQYCQLDQSDTIFVDNAIIPDGLIVSEISGPGITELGYVEVVAADTTYQVLQALFDPEAALLANANAADPTLISIQYSIEDPADSSNNEENVAAQDVIVVPLPELEYEEPEYNFCTYDEVHDLQVLGSNNLNTFTFSLITEGLPDSVSQQILSGDSISGFRFDPMPLDSFLVATEQESIEIEIEYRYTNAAGCSDSERFSFKVFKQPDKPIVFSKELCLVDGVLDEALVTDTIPGEELKWYSSLDFSVEPVGTGHTFTPSQDFFAARDERTFYVIRRNVNSSGEDDEICASEVDSVTYRRVNIPEFNWDRSVYGTEGVTFTGFANQENIEALKWSIFRLKGGSKTDITKEVLENDSASVVSANFDEQGAGRYEVMFTIFTDKGCSAFVKEELLLLPKADLANKYSYDFNGETADWFSYSPNGFSSEWELSTPANSSNIKSDSKIWITNSEGTYESGITSYVYSPAFDISAIERPVVSFDFWLDVIGGDDGLILEYSTDDKIIKDPEKQWHLLGSGNENESSGLNWYNQTEISANPGTIYFDSESNENINNNQIGNGWSVEDTEGEVEMTIAKHALESIPIDERENVVFRFQFKSRSNDNEDFINPDGVAFDNFRIESLNRNVLIEYFGDSEEEDDETEMRAIQNAHDNLGNFAWINYRVNENDSLYRQQSSSMLSRIYYYDAYELGGQFAIDGEIQEGYTFAEDESNAGLNNLSRARLFSSIANLDLRVENVGANELEITAAFDSSEPLNENVKLFVAVLQKEIIGGTQGTAVGTNYYNVLRKLLPGNSGLEASGISAEHTTYFKASRPSDEEALAVVAFLQDIDTREIIQSAYTEEFDALTFQTVTSNTKSLKTMDFQLYPNPASSHLNISWGNVISSNWEAKLVDLTGKVIEEFRLEGGTNHYELSTKNLKTGMYNLMITNDQGEYKMLKFAVTN